MAANLDKLAKHLNCAICLERLKEPKVLTCQHTYCRICLEKLVAVSDQQVYVHCPECREKTEIPLRGVKDLPPNFIINKLLSELGKQPTATPVCAIHEGEIIKLYCKSCDQLICRDCIIIDHRDHKYKFVKDIYPAEKEKIEEVVAKSRRKILALERSIKTIDDQEGRAEINCKEVSSKVDDVINQQIKLLQEKGESLKAKLQELAWAQKRHRDSQKKSFESSLDYMKQSVEFAEQAIRKGNKVEVLSAKKQIIKKLTDATDLATAEVKPRDVILYDIKIDSPQDNEVLGMIPKIIEYDEEFTIYEGYCAYLPLGDNFTSVVGVEQTFTIRGNSKHDAFRPVNTYDVEVKIKQTNSNDFRSLYVEKNDNGTFRFSFSPIEVAIYEIEVMINGRFVKGSPFKWKVEPVRPRTSKVPSALFTI